jgi:hypothetical protein
MHEARKLKLTIIKESKQYKLLKKKMLRKRESGKKNIVHGDGTGKKYCT